MKNNPESAFHFMAHHTGALILAQAKGDSATRQARWRQTVQGQFLDWLSAGGFQAEQEQEQEQAAGKEGGDVEEQGANIVNTAV